MEFNDEIRVCIKLGGSTYPDERLLIIAKHKRLYVRHQCCHPWLYGFIFRHSHSRLFSRPVFCVQNCCRLFARPVTFRPVPGNRWRKPVQCCCGANLGALCSFTKLSNLKPPKKYPYKRMFKTEIHLTCLQACSKACWAWDRRKWQRFEGLQRRASGRHWPP